jgi:hypothetical protein
VVDAAIGGHVVKMVADHVVVVVVVTDAFVAAVGAVVVIFGGFEKRE